MTITKTIENNSCILSISGRLDTITSTELEKEKNDLNSDITNLVLDLKDLEYISSAGLRVVLSLQKLMNTQGEMSIKNAQPFVLEVFDITGFTSILNIKK